jgi:NitT/TauT family transport system permease protein
MMRVAPLRPALEAFVDLFRYVPVPALVPLTILFFGVGEAAKIILLFLGTFFQLVLLFVDNFRRVPQSYYDLFFCLRFSEPRIWRDLVAASAPELLDSSRVTVGWCWTYVIIAELVAADHGIGHAIKEAQRFSDTAGVFAGIVVMAAIGFATDLAFRLSANVAFPYLRARRS